ncbi:MAG: phage scaffolding protein [Clostridia bacterium]|nr:phage scaffolding protein [Clostridia bacterium]
MEENNMTGAAEETGAVSEAEENVSPEVAALQEQIRLMEKNHTADLQKMQIEHETKYALTRMGAKNPSLAAKVLDMSAITMDNDGIHGLNEQLDKLRVSDPYLFHNTGDKEKIATGTSHGTPFADPESMTDAEYYRFVRRF